MEPTPEPFDLTLVEEAKQALESLSLPDDGARSYLNTHLTRLARTLALVPQATRSGACALELGCYSQITPFLHGLRGYATVVGSYFGPAGKRDAKTAHFAGSEFRFFIDCYDAERDRFPYMDESFDLVVAGEIIEHLLHDPMWMLLECRRVLREGGYLVITTPNIGSITSVAKTLGGRDNPQIYSQYKRLDPGAELEIGHMREYTADELGRLAISAGFDVNRLFTTHIDEYAIHLPLLQLLADNGYSTANRGEQTWCLAVKNSEIAVDRFPGFLYDG